MCAPELYHAWHLYVIQLQLERAIYSNIANKELKPRVMRLVSNIKEMVYIYRERDGELLLAFDKKNSVGATKTEQKRVRIRYGSRFVYASVQGKILGGGHIAQE